LAERSEYLRDVGLFAELAEDRRARIADQCTWKTYEPGTTIFSQGDTPGGVCFLAKGTVRASIYSASGKNVVFQDMHAGRMFGEISAIDGSERSAGIEAQTHCLIAMLSPSAFTNVLLQEPELGLKVVRLLTGEIRRLSSRIVEFSTLPVRHRVHAELLRLSGGGVPGETECSITPAPKLSDIADKISTHREAVSRELSRLTKSGLLVRTSEGLRITDIARLEQMVADTDLE
jgi:CRP-like cAMP-binding protein